MRAVTFSLGKHPAVKKRMVLHLILDQAAQQVDFRQPPQAQQHHHEEGDEIKPTKNKFERKVHAQMHIKVWNIN